MGLIHVVSVPGSRSGALGLLLLAAGGALALSTLAVAAGKPLPGLVFGTAAARFVLAGAFELEGQQRRPVLPTFRRGRGALAIRDGIDAQVDGIAHEAGVRRTT